MKSQQTSVAGLIVRNDGKFLLVHRSPEEDFMPGVWELPGGGSEYGETPKQAVQREIKEECGIEVAVHNPLAVHDYLMGEVQRVELVFFCTMQNHQQSIELSSEHDSLTWISLPEVDKYEIDEYMKTVIYEATADLDFWLKKYF